MPAWQAMAVASLLSGAAAVALAAEPPPNSTQARQEAKHLAEMPPVAPHGAARGPIHVDPSGRTEKGKASFYAPSFADRKMADGHRMNPNADVAASKTLPLGSVAKVENLENGKSATVKIEDRGPYVDGRVVDLTPKVAKQLDIVKQGVAPVEVKPITVPQPDGTVKLGAGGAAASSAEIRQATETTKDLTEPHVRETADRR